MFIMDAVQLLFQQPMIPIDSYELTMIKKQTPFIKPSYEEYTKQTLMKNLLPNVYSFSENEKDFINEETIELLEPYLTLKTVDGVILFEGEVAAKASKALSGLCTWAAAMSDYHKASKIVKPKLRLLEIRTA